MKETKNTMPVDDFEFCFISECQKNFIKESTYNITTPGGKNFRRAFKLLAYNLISGNILLREKVYFCDDKYEKIYILSTEGKKEKYSGNNL